MDAGLSAYAGYRLDGSGRQMKRTLLSVAIAMLMLLGVRFVLAQGGGEPHHITRWTLGASAGGVITSSSFIVAGTTAQASIDVGSGSDHYSSGGIWPPHYIPSLPGIVPVTPGPIVVPTIVPIPTSEPTPIPEPEDPDVPEFDTGQMAGGNYFPDSLNLPGCPDLAPPDFPGTLNLPDMPTLGIMSYITDTFSSVISLTQAIMQWNTVVDLGLILGDDLADIFGIDMSGFRDGTGSPETDLETFTLAGYTAEEMATELTSGFDLILSYLRSVNDIGIIGPTVAALLLAFAWVMFLVFLRFVLGFIVLPIWLLRRIWELLPFT